jgi:hypothetical protein
MRTIAPTQMMLFERYDSPCSEEIIDGWTKEVKKNVINLRQDLRFDIPKTTYLTPT